MIEDTPAAGLYKGLKGRRRHYRALFAQRNPSTAAVMTDLAKFCSFFDTTYDTETGRDFALILEGRRQVFLRILQHTKLSPEELFAHFGNLDEPTRLALFSNRRAMPVGDE